MAVTKRTDELATSQMEARFLKRIGRLRKKVRLLRLYNGSLKKNNKEMVLTIQMLKGSVKDAETKLRTMQVELCQAESKRNSMQEKLKKLSGLMPEVARLMHDTSAVFTKMCGVMTESVQDLVTSFDESTDTTQLPQPGIVDRSSKEITNVSSFNPSIYRIGLSPVLSPVQEQNSRVSVERNEERPVEADSTLMNSGDLNCIEESTMERDESEVFDNEHVEPVEEVIEEKPSLLELSKTEYSFRNDVTKHHSRREDILRDNKENSSLTQVCNDPGHISGISDMSTLPYTKTLREHENNLSIPNGPSEDSEVPVIESPLLLAVNTNTSDNSQGQSSTLEFTNVFPRKRRAAIIEASISHDEEGSEQTTTKDLTLEEQESRTERLSASSDSARRKSRSLEKSQGSSKTNLQNSPGVSTRSSIRSNESTEGRRTRKAVKSYKEPNLNKKLRR